MIIKVKKLNDGNEIPVLGLGTWQSPINQVKDAVKYALTKADYKHLDCASAYGNEEEIGIALQESLKEINRDQIFITSKLWNTDHRPENVEKAIKKTLSDLKLDYLNLYLIHWGVAFKLGVENGEKIIENIPKSDTWTAMEDLVKKGLTKSIGVSNFTIQMLTDLMKTSKIIPAVNQVELHPYNTQKELIEYCEKNNITVTAYSPLGRHSVEKNYSSVLDLFNETILKELSTKYNKTIAQILLNWAILRGTIPIPKSVAFDRILENINIFDFELNTKDQEKIYSLNKNYRFVNPKDFWDLDYFD